MSLSQDRQLNFSVGRVVRAWSRNMILVSLSILVTLSIVETGLRTVRYRGYWERANIAFGSDFGDVQRWSWLFRLGKHFEGEIPERIKINGEEIPIKKAENETRILFLGDSGTLGRGVGYENSYPILTRRDLEKLIAGNRIRVINAAEDGLTTVNELLLFQNHLRRLKPNIVILGLFMANDINFNIRYEADLFSHFRQNSVKGLVFNWLRRHSAVAHFSVLHFMQLNDRYKLIRWGQLEFIDGLRPLTAIDEAGFNFLNYLTGELALYRKEPSRLAEHSFTLMARLLQSFSELSNQDGFHFGVVLIPTSSTLAGTVEMYEHPEALETLQQLGMRQDDLDFGLPTKRILDLCREKHIHCFDPTPLMQLLGARVTILPKNDHLSLQGHRILASTVIKGIFPWLDRP
jgi:hypothetical protein